MPVQSSLCLMAGMVRDRAISPVELVESHLAQIAALESAHQRVRHRAGGRSPRGRPARRRRRHARRVPGPAARRSGNRQGQLRHRGPAHALRQPLPPGPQSRPGCHGRRPPARRGSHYPGQDQHARVPLHISRRTISSPAAPTIPGTWSARQADRAAARRRPLLRSARLAESAAMAAGPSAFRRISAALPD